MERKGMLLKIGVISFGAGLMVKAMMESDCWDNIKVQIAALIGFAMFWFGIGLLF